MCVLFVVGAMLIHCVSPLPWRPDQDRNRNCCAVSANNVAGVLNPVKSCVICSKQAVKTQKPPEHVQLCETGPGLRPVPSALVHWGGGGVLFLIITFPTFGRAEDKQQR